MIEGTSRPAAHGATRAIAHTSRSRGVFGHPPVAVRAHHISRWRALYTHSYALAALAHRTAAANATRRDHGNFSPVSMLKSFGRRRGHVGIGAIRPRRRWCVDAGGRSRRRARVCTARAAASDGEARRAAPGTSWRSGTGVSFACPFLRQRSCSRRAPRQGARLAVVCVAVAAAGTYGYGAGPFGRPAVPATLGRCRN